LQTRDLDARKPGLAGIWGDFGGTPPRSFVASLQKGGFSPPYPLTARRRREVGSGINGSPNFQTLDFPQLMC
jgi:hypothetical protein